MISIKASNVTKRFGETIALDHVDLVIEQGEIFFLLGPSGCGKTTLLRTIAGFYTPDEGKIFFGDEDVTDLPPHKRNTGMMFQSYALWPHMTVAKNVAFGLEERKIEKTEITRRVKEALASVKMEQYASRKIHQLSGGQQQRIALARALVIHPRCLLLDEPLSNSDASTPFSRNARGDPPHLQGIRPHRDLRHARPEGGALHRRPHRPHGKWPHPAGRHPSRNLPPAAIETRRRFHRRETNILLRNGHQHLQTNRHQSPRPSAFLSGIITKPGWQPQNGENVLLSIRPESWRLRIEPAAINSVKGRIGESIYLGEMAQHQIIVGDVPLKIYEMNPRLHGAGGDIYASAEPEDVVILPK